VCAGLEGEMREDLSNHDGGVCGVRLHRRWLSGERLRRWCGL